jgi:signal transduction histidine kinase
VDHPASSATGARPRPGWIVLLACVDALVVAAFLWLAEHTSPPPLPLLVLLLATMVGVLVGPWAWLVARRLAGEATAGRILRRVLAGGTVLAGTGVVVAALIATGGAQGPDAAGSVAMFAILVAGLLLLVGVVVLPWLFLLTRTLARERAARVRAEERTEVATHLHDEERTEVATHLHDSVLQTLTLIQKRTGDPAAMARLARHAERELRGWLYGPDAGAPADLAGALRAAAAEVEDRFGVSVELVTVGTCPLDGRARGVVAAAGEALVNAAKHAGVAKVSLFAEVAGDQLLVAVRDRGRGFDPAATGRGRHGLAESIAGRMRRLGGTATIHTAPGSGTEVELRLPLGDAR